METIYAQFSASKTTTTSQEWNGRDSDELCGHNTIRKSGYTDFKARFYTLDHEKENEFCGKTWTDRYFKQVAEIDIEPSDELLRIICPLFRGGYTRFYYNFGEDDKWYTLSAATGPKRLDSPLSSWSNDENTLMNELRAIWHEDLHREEIKPKTWDEIE